MNLNTKNQLKSGLTWMFPFAASGEPDERKPVVSDSIFFLPVPVGTGLETPAAAARA